MKYLFGVGRIFYGISIGALGIQTVYFKDFPYMLIPPKHSAIPGLAIIACIFGILLIIAGACIIFEKGIRTITLLLGSILLLIFCFYFVPYEFIAASNYMQFGAWENAEKELALSAGAFVIAGCYPQKNKNAVINLLAKPMQFGIVLFALTIVSFGIDHFLYAEGVSGYMPSWISNRMFWVYFAGTALIGSGIGIILKIKPYIMAFLLGAMIFTWFIILHIPKAITTPVADMGSEVTSAFLALAYSGTAFVIASETRKKEIK